MASITPWTPQETKDKLSKRLRNAKDARMGREKRWQMNERIIFNTEGTGLAENIGYSFDADFPAVGGTDQGTEDLGINYMFKNLRFIHAQMSANPPSVVPRPASNDPDDRRKADAADRLVRYAMREYSLQDKVDKASLNTLLYGTGIMKTIWNVDKGDILDVDESTGALEMEGEFDITIPAIWNIFIDPDATSFEEVNFIFEKITVDWEEALFKWPEKAEMLAKHRIKNATTSTYTSSESLLRPTKYDVVELFEFWEKGTPMNGYLGRFCICTKDGDLVSELMPNPERYAPVGNSKTKAKRAQIAVLPYHFLTDIDVPQTVWGKSFVEFGSNIQDKLNKMDTVTLEAVQAHGVPRMILPEGSEIAEGSITNSPWDVIKITGTQVPSFMNPMPLPQIMPELLARYKTGIDDMSGVNEAMMGQQSRETSGFSMQYATNQGNMIRRRLFNKYTQFVEDIYKSFLRIVRKHWEIPRTICVLGKEKAFEAMDIKGADIDHGFDLVVEYGSSLSLDPTTRREEIMTLMPIFEKAGVETRQILRMLKLNELSGMYDTLDMAADRQREVFEEMCANGIYLAPEELQDHKNMLTYAYMYIMTSEFKYITDEEKNLVRRHIKEREQLAAQGAQAAAQANGPVGGQPPGPLPQGPAEGAQLPPLTGGQTPVL